MEIEGSSNIARSVQIAQLALKHRQNKNQRSRLVLFVGSPIAEDKVSVLISNYLCHVQGQSALCQSFQQLQCILPILGINSVGAIEKPLP